MSHAGKITSFVRLDQGETIEREYYITHTSKVRFGTRAITLIVAGLIFWIIPGVILIIYFALRQLKVSHGYAAVTPNRIIYYEYNDHPEESYQHIRSLHLEDITGVQLRTDRMWFSKSFQLVIWTEKKAMAVGAKGLKGWLRIFAGEDILEPGPDALQFVQDVSGMIVARRFAPESASRSAMP